MLRADARPVGTGRRRRAPGPQRGPRRPPASPRCAAATVAAEPAEAEAAEAAAPQAGPSSPLLAPLSRGHRPRVLVVGSGWGGYSFIKALRRTANVDVTMVSLRNFFLYTPLLPGAACGTVEERSIVEPIRGVLSEKGYGFYEAAVLRIDPARRTVLCRAVDVGDADLQKAACALHTFTLEYDVLVLAPGAVPNTFGTPGVESHAMFFKEADDAARFRRAAAARFERASLPGVTAAEARELLTFVVVGAGPTGVELAAELHDMVQEDVSRTFPASLLAYVTIAIVDLQDFVLSSYDRRIAAYATEQFRRQNITLYLGQAVKAVEAGALLLADKKTGAPRRVPFGLCVWVTGIKMNPLCAQLASSLPPGTQPNVRSLTCDASLRVLGSGGTIFAVGDAATVELKPAAPHVAAFLPAFNARVTQPELAALLRSFAPEFPHLAEAADRVEKSGLFAKHATALPPPGGAATLDGGAAVTSADNGAAAAAAAAPLGVGQAELRDLLAEMDRGLRTLPATAQVARQQGIFLAELIASTPLEVLRRETGSAAAAAAALAAANGAGAGAGAHGGGGGGEPGSVGPSLPEFAYAHKGSLAYVGSDAAVADIPGVSVLSGLLAGLLWKGFETASQFSLRNRILVAGDLLRAKLFGRDMSRV